MPDIPDEATSESLLAGHLIPLHLESNSILPPIICTLLLFLLFLPISSLSFIHPFLKSLPTHPVDKGGIPMLWLWGWPWSHTQHKLLITIIATNH